MATAKLICSAGSLADLVQMINQYYCSNSYIVTDAGLVHSTRTGKTLTGVQVVSRRGRWRFERTGA